MEKLQTEAQQRELSILAQNFDIFIFIRLSFCDKVY